MSMPKLPDGWTWNVFRCDDYRNPKGKFLAVQLRGGRLGSLDSATIEITHVQHEHDLINRVESAAASLMQKLRHDAGIDAWIRDNWGES